MAEVLAMLQDSETVADITVVPESEMHAHDTDCDSNQSDDQATGDHNHLPSRLLKGKGFLPNSDMQLPNPPDDDPGCSSSVSQTETRKVSGTNEKVTSPIVGPIDATMEMSNLYARQKGKTLNLTEDELLTFYGILLTSGYSTVPRRRPRWSDSYDVSNTAVKNAMNRCDEIIINNAIPIAEHVAIDEMMIEYFGMHGCKQFIRGKPICFGYKIWSLASPSGFVHQMEPYAGSHTRLVETGLGQGPSVVLGLAEKAKVPPGVKFYHDSLFTTLSLVDEMTLRGYGSCGMLRQNQLHSVPFTAPQTFKKTPRGDAEYLVEGEKLIVRWNDKSVVTVVSNREREFIETEVRQPKCIQDYNTHMGGVDLHDQFVSRYRAYIRSKKWCVMVNSWCYYRYTKLYVIRDIAIKFVMFDSRSSLMLFG
uniref:PiggyBac transposable element-derived protein domain-containing protein n=1 Tax=Stegastes partitus TaxID=144197 RepID=A0A3B5B8W4_9TELE